MSTRQSIIKSFKKLATKASIEAISVSAICAGANTSRTAFYSCFDSKDDLFIQIVKDDLIDPIYKLRELLPTPQIKNSSQFMLEQIYNNILRHKAFYQKIYNLNDPNLFQNILIEQLCDLNRFVQRNYLLDEVEREYIAYFYAASHATLICRWIKNGMDLSPTTMANYFYKWAIHYLEEIAVTE